MSKFIYLLLIIVSFLNAVNLEETINKRNLFENQKEVFKEKEEQKKEKIIHYDIQKPKMEEQEEGKCFDIKEIKEVNFSLLSEKEKSEVFNKYLNKCNTINDIKNLINEITSLYIDNGYITSKIYLKAQNIKDGTLTLYAVEGKIEDITTDKLYIKNSFYDLNDNYLNLRDLEVGIENLNNLNSNNAKLNLKPGSKPGLSIVEIENKPSFPINGYLTYNNFGSNPTGKHQFGLNLNINNLIGFSDVFSINYNTTDKQNTQNNSIGDTYRYSFPIGRLLYSLSYSESKYKQVIPAKFLEFYSKGKNKNYTFDLMYRLFHNQNNKVNLGYFINYYTSKNYINEALVETSTYNLSKTGLKLNYIYQSESFFMNTTVQHVRGVHWFNNENPTDLDDKFKVFILDNYISKSFNNFKYSLDFHYQRSSHQLFSVNQLSIGGPYSVRGYKEDGLSGNTGYYYRNELSYPINFDTLKNLNPTPYIALDGGWIKKQEDTDGGNLLGEAIGLKLNYKKLYYDMYYSKAIKTNDVTENKNFLGFNIICRF